MFWDPVAICGGGGCFDGRGGGAGSCGAGGFRARTRARGIVVRLLFA